MTVPDVVVCCGAVLAMLAGWRIGLLGRVCSWAGLLGGMLAAARLLPPLVGTVTADDAARALGLGLVMIAAAVGGKWAGLRFGRWLHDVLPGRPLRVADRGAGAALGLAGVVALLWLAVPVAASLPGWPARAARRSLLAREVAQRLPQPPAAVTPLLALLRSVPSLPGGDARDPLDGGTDGGTDRRTGGGTDGADPTLPERLVRLLPQRGFRLLTQGG